MTIDNLTRYFSALSQSCKLEVENYITLKKNVRQHFSDMGEGALHLYLSTVPQESVESEEAWKAWREFQYSIFCNSL